MSYNASEISNTATKIVGCIFSWGVIACINIGISGYLWGEILSLNKDGDDYFKVLIPRMFKLKITGQQVIAGFAAFTISLLFVGLFLHKIASNIFIDNLEITKNKTIACHLLATSSSVIFCILILCSKVVVNYFIIKKNYTRNSDTFIVKLLTASNKEEDPK